MTFEVKVNKPKIVNESDTRQKFLNRAFLLAGELGRNEIQKILDRYDAILKKCTNQQERINIAEMGLVELHRAFSVRGELVVNGKLILPADKDFVPPQEENYPGKITKLT